MFDIFVRMLFFLFKILDVAFLLLHFSHLIVKFFLQLCLQIHYYHYNRKYAQNCDHNVKFNIMFSNSTGVVWVED
jgi:hypothetical protein